MIRWSHFLVLALRVYTLMTVIGAKPKGMLRASLGLDKVIPLPDPAPILPHTSPHMTGHGLELAPCGRRGRDGSPETSALAGECPARDHASRMTAGCEK